MQHLVRRTASLPFRRFLGDVRREFMQRLLMLSMELWVPVSATLCMRAVLMSWHAFLFRAYAFFHVFFFLLGGLRGFFL
jgi:hypothetical protein